MLVNITTLLVTGNNLSTQMLQFNPTVYVLNSYLTTINNSVKCNEKK